MMSTNELLAQQRRSSERYAQQNRYADEAFNRLMNRSRRDRVRRGSFLGRFFGGVIKLAVFLGLLWVGAGVALRTIARGQMAPPMVAAPAVNFPGQVVVPGRIWLPPPPPQVFRHR